jgi:hypothetical protein
MNRAASRRAERGRQISKPKGGERRTKQETQRIRERQQQWINSDEAREVKKFANTMASLGHGNVKHLMEHYQRYIQIKEQIKAHLQDQECK